MKISKSPSRHSFQRNNYVDRKLKSEDSSDNSHMDYFDSILKTHNSRFDNPNSRINNLEWDLLTTDWILEKVRSSEVYAQNLYCAICNNDFIKRDLWPMLKEQKWHCSWRYAGGIIADMREQGDYIDWYCSGIRDSYDGGYVSESVVTEEIERDLNRLGWIVA
jgi:hypothetical protein